MRWRLEGGKEGERVRWNGGGVYVCYMFVFYIKNFQRKIINNNCVFVMSECIIILMISVIILHRSFITNIIQFTSDYEQKSMFVGGVFHEIYYHFF